MSQIPEDKYEPATLDYMVSLPTKALVNVLVGAGRIGWHAEDRARMEELIDRLRAPLPELQQRPVGVSSLLNALESIEHWRHNAKAYDADMGHSERTFCEDVALIEDAACRAISAYKSAVIEAEDAAPVSATGRSIGLDEHYRVMRRELDAQAERFRLRSVIARSEDGPDEVLNIIAVDEIDQVTIYVAAPRSTKQECRAWRTGPNVMECDCGDMMRCPGLDARSARPLCAKCGNQLGAVADRNGHTLCSSCLHDAVLAHNDSDTTGAAK